MGRRWLLQFWLCRLFIQKTECHPRFWSGFWNKCSQLAGSNILSWHTKTRYWCKCPESWTQTWQSNRGKLRQVGSSQGCDCKNIPKLSCFKHGDQAKGKQVCNTYSSPNPTSRHEAHRDSTSWRSVEYYKYVQNQYLKYLGSRTRSSRNSKFRWFFRFSTKIARSPCTYPVHDISGDYHPALNGGNTHQQMSLYVKQNKKYIFLSWFLKSTYGFRSIFLWKLYRIFLYFRRKSLFQVWFQVL